MRPDTKTPPKTAKKTAPSAGAKQNTKQNAKTDMKQVFADGAKALIFDRNVTKLTVKDLAAQCHVTRQTFYYHFEDIPHLLRWIMDSDSEKLISQCMNQENREEGLRHFIVTLLNLKPYVKYDMSAAQRLEVERIMEDCFLRFFERADGPLPELQPQRSGTDPVLSQPGRHGAAAQLDAGGRCGSGSHGPHAPSSPDRRYRRQLIHPTFLYTFPFVSIHNPKTDSGRFSFFPVKCKGRSTSALFYTYGRNHI